MTLLVALGVAVGLAAYAFIATIAAKAIGSRCSVENEAAAWLAGVLWPAGVPVVAGVWLARRLIAGRKR
jgi:hypothetical protein